MVQVLSCFRAPCCPFNGWFSGNRRSLLELAPFQRCVTDISYAHLSGDGAGIPGRIENRSAVSTSARYRSGRALGVAGPLLGRAFAALGTQIQRASAAKIRGAYSFFLRTGRT
jgi:hypothetical protein